MDLQHTQPAPPLYRPAPAAAVEALLLNRAWHWLGLHLTTRGFMAAWPPHPVS